MSAIDLVISFYRLLNVPAITGLLGDGKVWRYQRPLNSDNVDVVISVPEYVGGSFNVLDAEINVYAPNIQNFSPIGHPDPTHPDVVVLKSVTDAILSLLDGYSIKVAGKLIQDKSGVWYSNIVVEVADVNPSLSIPITLYSLQTTNDGYGGVTVSKVAKWTGEAAMTDTSREDRRSVDGEVTSVNLRTHFVFKSDVAPQKNMELSTDEGVYVIRGISFDNGMWRLNTIRKDMPYA